MADIKINRELWNAVSEERRRLIVAHLKAHQVIKETDDIVGDADTPAPNGATQLYGATIGEATATGLILDWKGKAACDAAAAAAVAACGLTGPGRAVCLAAIAAAREACRSAC